MRRALYPELHEAMLLYRILGLQPVETRDGLAMRCKPGPVSLVCIEAGAPGRRDEVALTLLDLLGLPLSYPWAHRIPGGVRIWFITLGVELLAGGDEMIALEGCEAVLCVNALRTIPPTDGFSFFTHSGIPEEPPAVVPLQRLAEMAAR